MFKRPSAFMRHKMCAGSHDLTSELTCVVLMSVAVLRNHTVEAYPNCILTCRVLVDLRSLLCTFISVQEP